jgi:lipoprotein-anchoring transpeptidase ErfK/SrfK
MRLRVAVLAVLAFAVLDLAQGFGLLGDGPNAVMHDSAAMAERVALLPADSTPPTTSTTQDATPTLPVASGTAGPTPPPTTVATTTTTGPAPTTSPKQTPPDPVVARVVAPTFEVYSNPGDKAPFVVLPARTEFGNPRVVLALQERDGWVQVMLPVRPNGSLGWTKSTSVTLSPVPDVIDVDVNAHTLTWGRSGDVVLSVPVATGAPSSPTPLGTFYVTDVLREDPNGALGAWVLALNGHSDALTEFEGGDARIAIHGTNDQSSIGRAASFGCVRVDAGSLARLAAEITPGTPVVIH